MNIALLELANYIYLNQAVEGFFQKTCTFYSVKTKIFKYLFFPPTLVYSRIKICCFSSHIK